MLCWAGLGPSTETTRGSRGQKVTSGRPNPSTTDFPALTDPRTYRLFTPEQIHPGRNLSKATLKFYSVDGQRVALKDYGDLPFPVRNTIGRFFARREAKAYAAAVGTLGLPEFFGRVGPFALALDWIEARPLSALASASVPADLPQQLRRIVETLHSRGIAIGDLHHRDVLVAPDGTIHLVDLATAWATGRSPGPLRRALFHWLTDADRVALARIEARCSGRDEHEVVLASAGVDAARRYARGRRVKAWWDWLRGKHRRA